MDKHDDKVICDYLRKHSLVQIAFMKVLLKAQKNR